MVTHVKRQQTLIPCGDMSQIPIPHHPSDANHRQSPTKTVKSACPLPHSRCVAGIPGSAQHPLRIKTWRHLPGVAQKHCVAGATRSQGGIKTPPRNAITSARGLFGLSGIRARGQSRKLRVTGLTANPPYELITIQESTLSYSA